MANPAAAPDQLGDRDNLLYHADILSRCKRMEQFFAGAYTGTPFQLFGPAHLTALALVYSQLFLTSDL